MLTTLHNLAKVRVLSFGHEDEIWEALRSAGLEQHVSEVFGKESYALYGLRGACTKQKMIAVLLGRMRPVGGSRPPALICRPTRACFDGLATHGWPAIPTMDLLVDLAPDVRSV